MNMLNKDIPWDKRIMVIENETGYTRYYYASESLSHQAQCITYIGDPDYRRITKAHGSNGALLYKRIYEIKGVTSFALVSEYLKVTRNPAFEWSKLDPQILTAIGEVYGEFVVIREPWLKCAIRSFRRLVAKN